MVFFVGLSCSIVLSIIASVLYLPMIGAECPQTQNAIVSMGSICPLTCQTNIFILAYYCTYTNVLLQYNYTD